MNKMFEVEGGKSNILKGWKNRLREDIHRLLPEKYGDHILSKEAGTPGAGGECHPEMV